MSTLISDGLDDTDLSHMPLDWSDYGEQDVAVAAFLMLLWRDMYPPWALHGLTENEWDGWGRPDGGFVDLGCVSTSIGGLLAEPQGNGLLVHILTSEASA